MEYINGKCKLTAFDIAELIKEAPKNVIHTKQNYSELYDENFEFPNHINTDEFFNFMDEIYDSMYIGELGKALEDVIAWGISNYYRKGIYHCDTQENEDTWRVQLAINVRMFPKAINLITNKEHCKANYMASFSGGDEVIFTFTLKKY